ncbi:MAG: hypothetical protein PHC75_08840 [Burkholderiales bacterium]|nr:hypothetical protein [Burkholderiales bacterium]
MLPILINSWFVNDSGFHNVKFLKVMGYFIVTIGYFMVLVILLQLLKISDIFIGEIRNKYLSENYQYCQIISGSPHDEFVIIENSSVPYKLILEESSIQYYKPKDGYSLWKNFTESDINDMKEYCKIYDNSLKQSTK